MSGVSGGAGGLSASGGSAGPSQAGLSSDQSFNVGGNAGIGSSQGINTGMIAVIAIVGVVALLIFRKR